MRPFPTPQVNVKTWKSVAYWFVLILDACIDWHALHWVTQTATSVYTRPHLTR